MRCRRTPLVLELPLWLTVGDHWLVNHRNHALYDQKDLRVFCRTYTSVEWLATILAGPLIRPSSSTIASLHDITGSFTSCYKSHRLLTRTQRSFINTTCWRRSKFFHYQVEFLHWLSSRDVIIQWWSFDSIHSETVCDASKRVRPLTGASDLMRYITHSSCSSHLLHMRRPIMKMGDHTTLHLPLKTCQGIKYR